jgi:hypothetical protein
MPPKIAQRFIAGKNGVWFVCVPKERLKIMVWLSRPFGTRGFLIWFPGDKSPGYFQLFLRNMLEQLPRYFRILISRSLLSTVSPTLA